MLNCLTIFIHMTIKLSPLSSNHQQSKGRQFHDSLSNYRTCFQRDRDRILHSTAFRRLEGKTQVFINNYGGDHYRNRLTHTLEVSQIAKTISRHFSLDDDLTEALALVHDIGHAPFGHSGERILDKIMKQYSSAFDHNIQALRIVTLLAHKHTRFPGMNLSLETLDGMIKHNGPIDKNSSYYKEILNHFPYAEENLNLQQFPSLEAQIVSLSDDIGYNAHDIDDGIRAGLISLPEIIDNVPMIKIIYDNTCKEINIKPTEDLIISSILRKLINLLIQDLILQTSSNISSLNITNYQDIMLCSEKIVNFSKETLADLQVLRDFLFTNLYRHTNINRLLHKTNLIIEELFAFYYNHPDCLPERWHHKFCNSKIPHVVICDFISGMTDRYAIKDYKDVFRVNW